MVIEAVHLDGTLGLPELGPGEHRQAQIDSCCIDRIKGVFEPEPVFRCQVPASLEKVIKHVLEYPVIPFRVCIGERAPVHAAQSQVIPSSRLRAKAGLDVPEAVLLRDLGIEDRDVLPPCGKCLHVPVALVAFRGLFKLISRTKL